jgi:predicted Fe-S protein YdhL (DUF1289 family)
MSETVNNTIDYNAQYLNHTRCFKCQRTTEGIEAFTSISKNGKKRICKTCNKCRGSVQKCFTKYRKPTMKEKYETIKKLIFFMNQDEIDNILEKMNDEEKEIIKDILS